MEVKNVIEFFKLPIAKLLIALVFVIVGGEGFYIFQLDRKNDRANITLTTCETEKAKQLNELQSELKTELRAIISNQKEQIKAKQELEKQAFEQYKLQINAKSELKKLKNVLRN